MNIEVVLLPEYLRPGQLTGKIAVIFDVLRATTSMTAALDVGVKEIRIFSSIDSARAAAEREADRPLLCGESKCLKPPGFDLGNSPGAFSAEHRDRIMFMATTNGTKAILAARESAGRFIASLANASAVAKAINDEQRDVVLLCAGTGGEIALEDVIGAGAIVDRLKGEPSDTAQIAARVYRQSANHLEEALASSRGGRNVIAAGLGDDVKFAARIDSVHSVGRVIEHAQGTSVVLR